MPHPERTLNNEAGDIFSSMKEYIESSKPYSYKALRFESKKTDVKKFKKNKHKKEVLISTIIADNEADSVEKCINGLGIKAKIKKYIHFEIDVDGEIDFESLVATDTFFNPSKEYISKIDKNLDVDRFLVRSKEDIHGQSITQTLRDRFNFTNLKSVQKGIIWEVKINSSSRKKDVDLILNSHIFANPVSQECHEY